MAAITRLSIDGYGAKRAGSFAGKEESEVVIPPEVEEEEVRQASYWPGYIPPRRRRRKKREPVVVEIAVEQQEVKYVALQQPVPIFYPSLAPVMESVEQVTRLIEARAAKADVMRKIEELEEEEDIIVILSRLQ